MSDRDSPASSIRRENVAASIPMNTTTNTMNTRSVRTPTRPVSSPVTTPASRPKSNCDNTDCSCSWPTPSVPSQRRRSPSRDANWLW